MFGEYSVCFINIKYTNNKLDSCCLPRRSHKIFLYDHRSFAYLGMYVPNDMFNPVIYELIILNDHSIP